MAKGPFSGLDPTARLVFGLIWDRYKLSSFHVAGAAGESPWYDYQRDEVFCIYSQEELADQAGVSERTVRRALETLRCKALIEWRKATYKGSNRYYITESTRRFLKKQ